MTLSEIEKASLAHVAEWLGYQKSPQCAADLKADKARRAKTDKKLGHSPKCTLSRCHPECSKGRAA
jgi:hypothetical protein